MIKLSENTNKKGSNYLRIQSQNGHTGQAIWAPDILFLIHLVKLGNNPGSSVVICLEDIYTKFIFNRLHFGSRIRLIFIIIYKQLKNKGQDINKTIRRMDNWFCAMSFILLWTTGFNLQLVSPKAMGHWFWAMPLASPMDQWFYAMPLVFHMDQWP